MTTIQSASTPTEATSCANANAMANNNKNDDANKSTTTVNMNSTRKQTKRNDYISWDDYFMSLAVLSAKRSKDPVTQVGACIVNEDNRIVSIGYNGMPYRCSDDEFPWCKRNATQPAMVKESEKKIVDNTDDDGNDDKDKDNNDDGNDDDDDDETAICDKNLYVVHAEANAILNKNSFSLNGSRLYTTLFPCNECAKLILQSRIGKVIYLSDDKAKKCSYRASKRMLNAAGIECELFKPVHDQISIDFSTFRKAKSSSSTTTTSTIATATTAESSK